jgi:hypothetical protein
MRSLALAVALTLDLAFVGVVGVVGPAAAIDFTQVLLDDDGCPMKNDFSTVRTTATVAGPDCAKSDRLDLTLGDLIAYTLKSTLPTEQPQPGGEEKYRRSELADAVRRAKDYEPSVEELALMKRVIGIAWPPGFVGAVYKKLDPSLAKRK